MPAKPRPTEDQADAHEAPPLDAPLASAAAASLDLSIHDGATVSPARRLQGQLLAACQDLVMADTGPAAAPAPETPADQRWSARRSLVFVVAVSAVLWGAIGGGVFMLLQ